MNLESCAFTLNMCWELDKNPVTRKLVSFHTSNLQVEGLRV